MSHLEVGRSLKSALSSSDLTSIQAADGQDTVLQDKAIGCTNGWWRRRRLGGVGGGLDTQVKKRSVAIRTIVITAADEVLMRSVLS